MESPPVLQMRRIRKTFPGVLALDGVDFELRKGEVHVLLGENGAGKSTLIKILSGAHQKDEGQILLNGREIEIRNPRHAQQLGIGSIYQELALVPHLSAAANIFLGREPCRGAGIIDSDRLSRDAQVLLDDLGMEIPARRPVRDLGVAQQQMVEVAKALSLDAALLIMDEPTSALTEHEIKALFAVIQRLKAKGVSLIYISHRLEELYEIGDRVTILRDGKNVGTCNIADVARSDLVRMMVNRELSEQFPKQKVRKGEELLRVEGLNRKGILKDISFSLHAGEVMGIAGLLGSGRTELARAIFGADRMDSGSIYVKGRLRRIRSPRQAIRMGIGLLTEDRKSQGLILGMSVKENICLPSLDYFARLGIIDAQREESAVLPVVRELRIKTPSLEQRAVYLSGGNQQKVVMSKWLLSKADILFFDEPTRGIDVGSKVEIYQWMNRLASEGAGIVMISSELPEILGMSDRILVMYRGQITRELSREEATQELILHWALGA
ncbi:MAG TPA: sugar ABC transporter ATP-binding protein [Acidobacteriota bacterium]|nr:sugar ABC transporter ATP-binding protein [Acidobacteriota bacterium]